MIQTIIAYLQANYIALLAVFISLISFCLNYINLMDKRRSEVYQLISDSFTKLLISRNQLKSVSANYEILITTLREFGESEYKYSFIEISQQHKKSIENSLNNIEITSNELIKIQESNNSGKKLTMLHALKFKLLTIDSDTTKAEEASMGV